MARRESLIGAAAAPVASASALAQGRNAAKLDRIAIMSLCFDRLLKNGLVAPDPARTLDVMDLPQMIVDRYGVRHVEMQHGHFLSTDEDYLREFKNRVAKAKSAITQINLEFGASNISAGYSQRAQAIDLSRSWIDHAVLLGCPRVMVNQGSLAPAVRQDATDALRIISTYGKAKNVTVTLENRDDGVAPPSPPPAPPGRAGGPPAPPAPPATWQVVVDVIKAAGVSATPDVGNFPNETERAAGLKAMFALTVANCHCHYDPARFNFANAVAIAKQAGYKGVYTVEVEGASGDAAHTQTKAILDELIKLI